MAVFVMSDTPTANDLLDALVVADLAARPERPRFRVTRVGGRHGVLIRHPNVDAIRVAPAVIEDLADHRLIRLKKPSATTWEFDLRPEAFEIHERSRQRDELRGSSESGSDGSALDWESNLWPVLQAVGAVYRRQTLNAALMASGVSAEDIDAEMGRPPNDPRTGFALQALVSADYLSGDYEGGTLGPAWCVPLEKANQLISGWPATDGAAAVARLLSLLDARANDAPTEDERKGLRALRAWIAGMGESVAADLLSRVLTGGL